MTEPRRVPATFPYALIQIVLAPQPDCTAFQIHIWDRRSWWRLLRHVEQAFLDEFVVFGCDGPGFTRLLFVRVFPEPDGNIILVDFGRFCVEDGPDRVICTRRLAAYLKIGR